LEILAAEGINVRVALMPAGDDPDTLLRSRGPAAVKEAAEGALTPIEYHLKGLAQKLDPGQEEYWQEVIGILTAATSESEIDRHLVEIAPTYPWVRNQAEAAKILRRQIMSGRRRGRTNGRESTGPLKSVKTGLSSAEAVLFGSILEEALRPAGWKFLSSADLFETLLGERIASALLQPFGPNPPEGRPVAWLHLVEPEDLRQTLSDLTLGFQFANLSEEKLADSVKRMIDSRDARERERMMKDGADRNAIFERARAKKPDPRNVKKDDNALF
jgi:DNA primase